MKLKAILYCGLLVLLAQALTACVPVIVGASAGAAGGYVYSKNYPAASN
ncbi:MAG: hypothetical protein K0S29_1084 [Gammaproteobacteria bacterium]|jgi:hypothetical protein|nr:hypothetical protein [Gammaproteobacteria bacterium]